MSVRAKFVVNTITRSMGSVYHDGKSYPQEMHTVKLFQVTGSGSPEDHSFWMSTPNGSIEMSMLNPAATEQFAAVLGKAVYVDFTPADD